MKYNKPSQKEKLRTKKQQEKERKVKTKKNKPSLKEKKTKTKESAKKNKLNPMLVPPKVLTDQEGLLKGLNKSAIVALYAYKPYWSGGALSATK